MHAAVSVDKGIVGTKVTGIISLQYSSTTPVSYTHLTLPTIYSV